MYQFLTAVAFLTMLAIPCVSAFRIQRAADKEEAQAPGMVDLTDTRVPPR